MPCGIASGDDRRRLNRGATEGGRAHARRAWRSRFPPRRAPAPRSEVDFHAGRSRSLFTGLRFHAGRSRFPPRRAPAPGLEVDFHAGRSRSSRVTLDFHGGRSRSLLAGSRFHAGRSRSLFAGLRFHAGRSRSLAMTSRFSAVEAGRHRGMSGVRAGEAREPAIPLGPPAMPSGPSAKASGLPAISLGCIGDPSGGSATSSALRRLPTGPPTISAASSDDRSRSLAGGLRGRLVEYRWKAEGAIGIAAPGLSPRMGAGPQRGSFVGPLEERKCHRVAEQSVAIQKGVIVCSEERIESGS